MNSPATPNTAGAQALPTEPDTTIDVRDTFGIDVDWQVPAFAAPSE
ncbi:MAG: cobaltochelatase subunit CobS, partial [Pseudomonadota bacterium]